MKQKNYQRWSRPLLLTLLSIFMAFSGASSVWADELTVYNSTGESTYYPVHGNYADTNNSLSEYIIPSTAISAMNGATISKMTFYISSVAAAQWTSTFTVYMKEIANTVYESSSAIGDEGATVVYTGLLDGTGSTMDVNFTNNYDYNGGNLLIGFKVTSATSVWKSATFVGETQSGYTSFRNKNNATREKFLPKTTFTYSAAAVEGSAFVVKDGSTKLSSPYAYNFGLTTAGTTKTFKLTNPGTAATPIALSTTGNVGASIGEATSIAAGGEVTLTLTMPDADASGTVRVTPTGDGLNPFVFNVSGTKRDANKVYETLLTGSIPEDWTTSGGTWSWSTTNGASNTAWNESSNYRLITPKLTIAEGEKFFFDAQGTYSGYQGVIFEYSSDGTTWTASSTTTTVNSEWQTFQINDIPAGNYYIAIHGWHVNVRNFYGGELPNEPKMVVTQPVSLSFGTVNKGADALTKTFTIANTGKAALEGISVISSNGAFTITNAPTSLVALTGSQEVTITMSTANAGNMSSDITVSATGMEDVVFTVTGTVMPTGLSVIDFNDNQLPSRWTNSASPTWSFSDGKAVAGYGSYGTYATMTTPKVVVNAGDMFMVKAKLDGEYSYYVKVNGLDSEDNQVYTKTLGTDVFNYTTYTYALLDDVPTTVKKFQFVGYKVLVDEIQGVNYAAALVVTDSESAVQNSGLNYDFGECAADANVTYNFANTGGETINITNVAITGDGADAYSTNWTTSVAAPFALTITRSYDAGRAGAGAQEAVVTVTTSEGDFVINVTGTDKAANAPTLSVSTNAIDFGKVTANAVQTVTVTNTGTGTMAVAIVSDSEDFEVSTASLTDIGAGQSKTFDITFKYGTPYGVKNGNVTVTPTYDGNAAETITVAGKAKDSEEWDEDFSGNALPDGWESDGSSYWTFSDGIAQGVYNSTYNMTKALTTPVLTVSGETDELTFSYKRNNAKMYIKMSKDGAAFVDLYKDSSFGTDSEWQTYTITGLEAGNYKFQFMNEDYKLDNFEGFKLKAAAEHEVEVKSQTIPTTGNQYVEYTASVDVKVTGTSDEQLTVKFYIGDTQYGESVVKDVTSNDTETFEVVFTPSTSVSGDAYFTIESDDIVAFESDKVAVTIAAAMVLDETVDPEISSTGTKASVVVKYNAKNGWNTICMPFALTDDILTSIFGTGWKAYEFKSYSAGVLGFSSTTTFYAGYPYIIYIETAAFHPEGVKQFNVNVADGTANYDQHGGVTFQGTYAPIADASTINSGSWYGVTTGGEIRPAGASATLKGFRAYFTGSLSGAHIMTFDDATGIQTVLAPEDVLGNNAIYDLKGQKVQNAKKGLYIMNGKKVVIK